jgi:ATP-binding cassette subfamily C exporter for protease/lipase
MSQSKGARNGVHELRQALDAHRREFRQAAALGFISSMLVLAPTIYMFEVYGRVVNSANTFTLLMLTVVVLGAFVVMEVLAWSRTEILRGVGDSLEIALMPRLYRAVFRMNAQRPGSGSVQPITDLRVVRDFLHGPALAAVPELPAAFVFLILLFVLSPVLGVLALVAAMLQVVITVANERRTHPMLAEANRLMFQGQQTADTMMRHAEPVRAMGMRPALYTRWWQLQTKMLGLQAKAADVAGGFMAANKLLQTAVPSALLGVSALLVLENALFGGAAMLIVGAVLGGRVLAPLAQLVGQWRSVVNVRESWKRLVGILASVPEIERGMALPPPIGSLTVEGAVALAPGGQTQILRGVQFALQPGDVLAVVGPSASGKTTLARLLVGVWPSLAGKVRLDGADVFAWNKDELGPSLGYLPQGVEMLDGTLAENIARFGDVNLPKVEAAARSVGIHDWILSLPDGYQTVLGPDGVRLSGGQRQRLALARALYGDPVFVVLDEPNSSLDEQGESALMQVVARRRAEGATFVLITHRTNALQVCTHMLVLRDGVQQAFGPRDEVLAALSKAASAAQQGSKNGSSLATGSSR